MINEQTDESVKELRLPIIEEAVMVVQGYIEPQKELVELELLENDWIEE